MSPSVQTEVLRKEVAPEVQERLIERAARIGHKMGRPAALRNWYKIPAWKPPLNQGHGKRQKRSFIVLLIVIESA